MQEMQERRVRSLGREDPLEKEMASHSSILAWKIPWTEEPGGLQSMGSPRVGHEWSENACMFLLYLRYQEFLLWKDIEFCQTFFLHLLKWSYNFYPSHSVYALYYIYWLAYVEPSFQPRDKSHLIVLDPFNVLLYLVCLYFVEDFCICIH